MGLSVKNQLATGKYFCLSHIDKDAMDKFNIQMSKALFRELARRTPAYMVLPTGSADGSGRRRMTKIYRYEDFAGMKGGDANELTRSNADN